MMTLYDYELSGNCYKVRLLLNLLNLDYKSHTIEFYPAAEHKSDSFLSINPLGELPVLDDNGFMVRDSAAILTYLATQYDPTGQWFPTTAPDRLAGCMQWLAFANDLTHTASAARLADSFFYPIDVAQARTDAHRLFRIMDEHLWFQEREAHNWLVSGKAPTVADIACFAYTILSEEGGISRIDYPAIRRWTDRVKRIPGFMVMPGIFPTGPDREADTGIAQ